MNRDKQIEEMAKAIEQARIKAQDTTNSMNYGFGGWYAKELYNAGYRKASDVAREIFEEIESLLGGLLRDYNRASRFSDADVIRYTTQYLVTELKKKYTEGEKTI